MRGLFIAGTNTEVGKTYVATAIVRKLVSSGRRVGVYKPVASGCRLQNGALVAEDAVALWHAAGKPGVLEHVCPQRFVAPLAPPRAARLEHKSVDSQLLRSGLEYWRERCDIVVVEGAGGLMSPLADDTYNADLAREFRFPLIIVAANELGTISATLQTVITAERYELPVAGIVLNNVVAPGNDASAESNCEELTSRCDVPLLTEVAHRGGFDRTIDWWEQAARY